jgi:hypothetical protein
VHPDLHLDQSGVLGEFIHQHVLALNGEILHVYIIVVKSIKELIVYNLKSPKNEKHDEQT